MADIENMSQDMRTALREGGIEEPPKVEQRQPMYKVVGSTKIPVSKQMGVVWQSRHDQAHDARQRSSVEKAWDESLRYYNHDQLRHRTDTDSTNSGNVDQARQLNERPTETENVVFANVTALVAAIYSVNPSAEFTTSDEEDKPMATLLERLVNGLSGMYAAPGFNIKPKIKKAVLMATCTNLAFIEVGYTHKEESSEQAMETIRDLSEKLSKAKDKLEIEEIEGQLMAVEKRIDILQPSGPWAKFRRPHSVLVDPDAEEVDLSDANWVMVCDYVSTSYIRATYMTKKGDEYRSIYNPTHVMKLGSKATDDLSDQVNTFSLLDNKSEASDYGYRDEDAYDRAKRTKVWYVWDKVTRRVYLFNSQDWTWPIWVWDDPYNLEGFFPFAPLWFYTSPNSRNAKGEVAYYLDQQDAINEIADAERRIRLWAKHNLIYNKDLVDGKDVEQLLKGPDGTARGVSLPEGTGIQDVIMSFLPPAAQFAEFLNTDRKLAAIDRISSVSQVMRGAEFKTNTTNQAIAEYNNHQSVRLEEKTDSVEDLVGKIYWMIAQMCVQFMSPETVAQVLGLRQAQGWTTMTAEEFRQRFVARVVGGTSTKPTSQAKKKEALEIAQILGQFASATPAAVVVALKVFESAFDEIVIKEEDWKSIQDSITAQLQRGNSNPGDPASSGDTSAQQVEQAIDQLPQQAKQMLGQMLAQGVPIRQAVQQVVQQASTPNQ